MLLVKGFYLGLISCPGRTGARVAATSNENHVLGTAPTARYICTNAVKKLAGAKARVDLVLATNTPPAHGVVVTLATLDGANATLQMEKDACTSLMLRIRLDAAAKPTAAAHIVTS